MKELQTGKEKVQKICDLLRKETLDPAKQEAEEILENARIQAEQMIQNAQSQVDERFRQADQELSQRKQALESSLRLACRQGVETLKQQLETTFFSQELCSLLDEPLKDPHAIAKIIQALISSMGSESEKADIEVLLPKTVEPRAVSELLAKGLLDRLQGKPFALGDFKGGAQVVLKDKKITLDCSDEVIKELIARFIRHDFRSFVFGLP